MTHKNNMVLDSTLGDREDWHVKREEHNCILEAENVYTIIEIQTFHL